MITDEFRISQCRADEIDDLVDFIRNHWNNEHIFVKSIELLKWQHLDGDKINFIIARHIGNDRIVGVFGFIPTSQYDRELIGNSDTWGAIWKVTDDVPSGLGLAIMQFFHDTLKPRSHGSISNTDIALALYKLARQRVGILSHYFILSDSVTGYTIAEPSGQYRRSDGRIDSSSLREIELSDNITLQHRYLPQKSVNYLINRYQKHPIYKYRFFGAYNGDSLDAILVFRKQYVGAASCLRIVDVYGDLSRVGRLYDQIQGLLAVENSEYADCMNHGIDESTFVKIGFEKLDHAGQTIIPNYFEPFEQRNIKINFALKSDYDSYVVFRGDGDQDRPSIIS